MCDLESAKLYVYAFLILQMHKKKSSKILTSRLRKKRCKIK